MNKKTNKVYALKNNVIPGHQRQGPHCLAMHSKLDLFRATDEERHIRLTKDTVHWNAFTCAFSPQVSQHLLRHLIL